MHPSLASKFKTIPLKKLHLASSQASFRICLSEARRRGSGSKHLLIRTRARAVIFFLSGPRGNWRRRFFWIRSISRRLESSNGIVPENGGIFNPVVASFYLIKEEKNPIKPHLACSRLASKFKKLFHQKNL